MKPPWRKTKFDKNGFVVVMLSPNKSNSGETSTAAATAHVPQTSSTPAPPSPEAPSTTPEVVPSPTLVSMQLTQAAAGGMPYANPLNLFPQDLADTMTRATPHTDMDIMRNSTQIR